MNILQTIATRKPIKIKDLSPGNGWGEGYPPQEMTSTMKIENEERKERTRKLGNTRAPLVPIFFE